MRCYLSLYLLASAVYLAHSEVTTTEKVGSTFRSIPGCVANRIYFPLCGSDGYSYSNYDHFNCAFKIEPALVVAHEGLCNEGTTKPVIGTETSTESVTTPLSGSKKKKRKDDDDGSSESEEKSGFYKYNHFRLSGVN